MRLSGGLSVAELAWVDWSWLDLGERLLLICVTGHLPNVATLTDRG